MLVDTGATLSVLGKEIFDKILSKTAPLNTMEKVGHAVIAANIEPLKVYGKLDLPKTIDNWCTIQHLLSRTYLCILSWI